MTAHLVLYSASLLVKETLSGQGLLNILYDSGASNRLTCRDLGAIRFRRPTVEGPLNHGAYSPCINTFCSAIVSDVV